MTGKHIRLGRLMSKGRPVIIAADHGSYMGPFRGIEALPTQINAFSKADAFLLMPGMAKQCQSFFAAPEAPLCIIRVNWAAHYSKPCSNIYSRGYNEKLADVRYAVSLGADIVIASLLLGTDEEANTRNITQFGQIAAEADELGIPLIGEYIPMGGIDRYTGGLENLMLGTRACAEFGADIIKTVYVPEFDRVAEATCVPTLVLGGGITNKPSDSFNIAADGIKKGAAGVVFGRNALCAENPAAYLDCLIRVVKEGMDPKEAELAYYDKIRQ